MNLKFDGKLPAPVCKIIDEESENWMVMTAEEMGVKLPHKFKIN